MDQRSAAVIAMDLTVVVASLIAFTAAWTANNAEAVVLSFIVFLIFVVKVVKDV